MCALCRAVYRHRQLFICQHPAEAAALPALFSVDADVLALPPRVCAQQVQRARVVLAPLAAVDRAAVKKQPRFPLRRCLLTAHAYAPSPFYVWLHAVALRDDAEVRTLRQTRGVLKAVILPHSAHSPFI